MNITLVSAVAALAVGFAGGWGAQGWRADARVAAITSESAQQRERQAEDAQLRERAARAEEQRRSRAQQEINDAATLRAQERDRDRRGADAAGDGLRDRAAAFAAGIGAGAGDPTVAGQCAAAEDRGRVLAELSRRVEEAGRRMAGIADERGDAGEGCERGYDALKPRE